jgi:heptosyltransferase-1
MKILIVRIGAMGDVLHALPAVAALRVAQPDVTIEWLVDDRWLPLLNDLTRSGPIVSTAFPIRIRNWKAAPLSPATIRDFLSYRSLRKTHYDLVLDMQGTLRSAALGRLAATGAFAGYADPRESLAASLYRTRLPRRGTHVVDQAAALVSDALGLNLTPTIPTFPADPATELWADETIPARPLALLAPDAGWAAKQWPADHFGQLALALHARGYHVLINAAAPDDPLAQQVAAASRNTATIQPCTIAQLIALTRRSGPLHLAAALATPLVALFGPTDPARNGPWGPGPKTILRHPSSVTSYKHTSNPDPGLARISVDDVLDALTRLQADQQRDAESAK